MNAVIETTQGRLEIELYKDDAPKTVANFLRLASKGFFDGLEFFRLIQEFVVHTGCPKNDGTGNAGYLIKCEINDKEFQSGTLAMAHCGRDTGSSQFFICLSDRNVEQLVGNHTIFGQVKEGLDNLNQLKVGDKITSVKIF
ncbi:MAG: peptidylprolyl isomerase [Cytophagales bacterium]|nr:MAG: peptidylprolyl isomerase [Cytophagales bacterium]TAF59754.1 MAG: peptidylprolyl isomerase [Cytophagales bacterium]